MPDDYNYGIKVTVTNLASAEIAKINKQLEGLGKQVVQNATITDKAAKQQQQATRAYGAQVEEQLTAKGYLNNLLKQDQATFKKTNAMISKQGALSKIYNEIRMKGIESVGKAQRKALATEAKQIKQRRAHGLVTSGWARSNEDAIIRLDKTYQKHGSSIRKTMTGMGTASSKTGAMVHRVSMGFLTLLGPLFLVGAAMRTVQQATDAIMKPFLSFEDGLYELRKTADLTKQEMLAMGDAIESMAQRIPIARTELVEIAATAGRLGIHGRENILNFTEVVAMMATATVLSADESANALARISNAFQLPIANVEYLGSIINELSNTTASNSREIVKSIQNVGASGKMIGISIDAVAAMSATLIASGMSAERSGTRMRRFFTEMARNSDKMAKEMDIDAAVMKVSIEEDPTKAIMDYLEHLREIPSRIDKVVEAQEIFGKVGGFAVATLAENYVNLEENMSNARTELVFGTSLQREFAIATSKTSAQLQMMDNRIESATASIGEDFVPALKGGKGVLADAAEALSEVSRGFWSVGENAEIAGSHVDVLVDEMSRLRTEAELGATTYDKIGVLIAAITGKTIGLSDPRGQKQSVKGILDVISGTNDLAIETEKTNKVYEIQDQLIRSANVAYGTQVKSIKEATDYEGEHGSALKEIEDLNIKIRESERGMAAAKKEGLDVSKEEQQLMINTEILRIRGMQTTRAAIKEKIASGMATAKEKDRYAEIVSYLDGYIDKNNQITNARSKATAAERLGNKVTEWRTEQLGEENELYIRLNAVVGNHAKAVLASADPQAALNKLGYEAVMIEDQLHIVRVEHAKDLYNLEDPLSSITGAYEKFNKVTSQSLEEFVKGMTDARDASSLLYYDIMNQVQAFDALGNTLVSGNETMRKAISNYGDMEKSGRRLVVTHKGLEVITAGEAANMKKLGSQIVYVTDAIEEMNELGQDSITIWGELTITQSDYEEKLDSIWGLTSSYINTLRKLGDAQMEFNDASETMPIRIQELWRPYEAAFDQVEKLVAEGKDYEAGIILQGMAQEINARRTKTHSKAEREDLGRVLGYLDDYVTAVGIIPAEYKAVEDEMQLMADMMQAISEGEIVIIPDLNDTPFNDAMKRLLDADYVTSAK